MLSLNWLFVRHQQDVPLRLIIDVDLVWHQARRADPISQCDQIIRQTRLDPIQDAARQDVGAVSVRVVADVHTSPQQRSPHQTIVRRLVRWPIFDITAKCAIHQRPRVAHATQQRKKLLPLIMCAPVPDSPLVIWLDVIAQPRADIRRECDERWDTARRYPTRADIDTSGVRVSFSRLLLRFSSGWLRGHTFGSNKVVLHLIDG
jgi:hypothetical protein